MSAVVTSTDIKTLLKLALPIGSRLITGYPATPVDWVSHLRTRPPIFADIEGHELILVSTETLVNYHKPLSLESVIEKLTQTQASALCVEGTLTPRAQQIARTHNFPLIALPDRAVLPQVERAVQRLLTDRDNQLDLSRFGTPANAPAPRRQPPGADDDAQRHGPDAGSPGCDP